MTAAVHTMLRDYAGSTWPTMNHKGRMTQLARKLGFGHRRVRSLYQNEPGVSVRADEAARIAALVAQKTEATRAADRALEARLAALEAEIADLRSALAGETVAPGGVEARGQGGDAYREEQGHPRRRAEDRGAGR